MQVRQFTEEGHKQYKTLIDDIFQSVEKIEHTKGPIWS